MCKAIMSQSLLVRWQTPRSTFAQSVIEDEAVATVLEHCPGFVVVNAYGPTETTAFATAHRVRESGPDRGASMTHRRIYREHGRSQVSTTA